MSRGRQAPRPATASASSRLRTSGRRGSRSSNTKRRSSTSDVSADFVLGDDFARVLTETTQALVCVLAADGRILFFNDACERTTGYTRDEVVGRDAREVVIPPEEAEAFADW